MSTSVSALLAKEFGINARPAGKIKCPFCGHKTFSIKRDDTLGKCFHPSCGRFLTRNLPDQTFGARFNNVMREIFYDFHLHLLTLANAEHKTAYSYLAQERRIHPQVIRDSMLGAVPPRYDLAPKFDCLVSKIESSTNVGGEAWDGDSLHLPKRTRGSADRYLRFLVEAREKFQKCVEGGSGWICFFYTDSDHQVVAVRFRKPYSKHILYFKPHEGVAGLFGHGLFSVPESERTNIDDFMIVLEGEFNQLQLQSLSLRYGETTGTKTGYVYAGAVGGVNNADYSVIRKSSGNPVFCYDNDSSDAGFALVTKARETMNLHAFTTPIPDSDLDQLICSFGDDHKAAWKAVESLVAARKAFPRIYSGTGREFFRERTFIPKRLADAILERQSVRYSANNLWIYSDGVYRPEGEPIVRSEAQALLGEERTERRIVETVRYLETATGSAPPDPDPNFINLKNGLLKWNTNELESHSAANFSVTQLPVSFDPTAVCPQFDRYLETTLTPETIPLMEEIIGYSLIQDTRFEKAVMLAGPGSNGKSVFLDVLSYLLGDDNIANIPLQELEQNRFAVAELLGKLANIVADIDNRALQSSSIFKMLVSGDRLKAERKFGHPFYFRSYAHLFFSANTLPPSRDRTAAFYRRWLIIPFERLFEGKNADKELRAKLRNELPGILNRALRGLRQLFSAGKFSEPPAAKAALEQYQQANDTVATFVSEFVVADSNAKIAKRNVYDRYRNWCDTQGLRPVTEKELKHSLLHIFPKLGEVRPSGGRAPWHWVGIRLVEDIQRVREMNATDDARVMQR